MDGESAQYLSLRLKKVFCVCLGRAIEVTVQTVCPEAFDCMYLLIGGNASLYCIS